MTTDPTDDELARIEAICHEFVRSLTRAPDTPVDEYVERVPESLRRRLLARLIQEHAEFRRRHGHTPTPEDYRDSGDDVFFDAGEGPGSCPTTAQRTDSAEVGRGGGADEPRIFHGSVGRFQLLAFVGRGGFGDVWRAYDPHLDREVALKIARADRPVTAATSAQFRDEARRQAALRDVPGVVTVHEAGEAEGRWYFVSDFVEGATLDRRMPALSRSDRVRIVAEVAGILHEAHRRQIVHRDVKPANVLLDADDRPQVTDFGIAATEAELIDEPANLVVGTFAYMAPEQVAGRSREADPRSDVYSLGAILYEALVDRRPFESDDLRLLRRLIADRAPWPPRSIDPSIDPRLERVCLRCLAKEPAERYSSAADVAAELHRFLRRPARRRAVAAGLVMAGLAVLAAYVAIDRGRHRDRDRGPGVEEFVSNRIAGPVAGPARELPGPWTELLRSADNVHVMRPAGARVELLPASRRVILDDATEDGTFVALGWVDAENYTFAVDFEQGRFDGGAFRCGLLFGGRTEVTEPFGRHTRGEIVFLNQPFDDGDWFLHHHVVRLRADRPVRFTGHAEIEAGVRRGEFPLEVQVARGALHRVNVDDQPVWRAEIHRLPDATDRDGLGVFGLYVRRGSVTLRNARIRIEPEGFEKWVR